MNHDHDPFTIKVPDSNGRVDSVIGPLGEILTHDLLPPPGVRWTARRKAEVVAAVHGGMLGVEEACSRYDISMEEFVLWERAIGRGGLPALRVTRLQMNRHILAPDWPGTPQPRPDRP